jgi:DNA-binding GntR family transcriptional regulator
MAPPYDQAVTDTDLVSALCRMICLRGIRPDQTLTTRECAADMGVSMEVARRTMMAASTMGILSRPSGAIATVQRPAHDMVRTHARAAANIQSAALTHALPITTLLPEVGDIVPTVSEALAMVFELHEGLMALTDPAMAVAYEGVAVRLHAMLWLGGRIPGAETLDHDLEYLLTCISMSNPSMVDRAVTALYDHLEAAADPTGRRPMELLTI